MRQSVGEQLIWVDWNAGPTSEDEAKAVEQGGRDNGDDEEGGGRRGVEADLRGERRVSGCYRLAVARRQLMSTHRAEQLKGECRGWRRREMGRAQADRPRTLAPAQELRKGKLGASATLERKARTP